MKPKIWAAAVTVISCLAFCFIVGSRLGVDFLIYRQAAMGNMDISLHGYRWLYANWLSHLWLPFTWLRYETAMLAWYAILISCCAFISTKLVEVRYGHFTLPLAVVAYCFSLYSGNIYPVLVALSFSPYGIILAALVKPQFLGLGLLMAFREYYRHRIIAGVHQKHRPNSRSSGSLVHPQHRTLKALFVLVALLPIQIRAQEPYNAGLKNVRDVSVTVSISDPDRLVLLNAEETAKLISINLRGSGIPTFDESDYSLVVSGSIVQSQKFCRGVFAYHIEVSLFEYASPLSDPSKSLPVTRWGESTIGFADDLTRTHVLSAIAELVESFIHHWKRDHGLIGQGF